MLLIWSRKVNEMKKILPLLMIIFGTLTMRAATTATPAFSYNTGTWPMPLSGNLVLTDSTPDNTIDWCYSQYGTCTPGTKYTGSIHVCPGSSCPTAFATETICANATASGYSTSATSCQWYSTQPPSVTGDGRGTAAEPTIPAVCQTLNADLSIGTKKTINNDPYNATWNGSYKSPGGTSLEPSSETSFDTSRIQSALNACKSTNKIVELAPNSAGTDYAFLTQPLTIPSGVWLWVDAGVTLYASRNFEDYEGSGCGTLSGSCKPFITSTSTTGAGIGGFGVIDARGWDLLLDGTTQEQYSWYSNSLLAKHNNNGHGVAGGAPIPTVPTTGGDSQGNFNTFQGTNADSFTAYKITFKDSPQFNFLWQGSTSTAVSGLTVWGMKIHSRFEVQNTDGIDPVCNASDVTIAHTTISNGDDSISIKAADNSSCTTSNATKNVTFAYNDIFAGLGISIGTHTNNGISNVLVDHIQKLGNLNNDGTVSYAPDSGVKIKDDISEGGQVTDVSYQNIYVQNSTVPVWLYTTYNCGASGSDDPQYTNIYFSNFDVLANSSGSDDKYFTWQGLSSSKAMTTLLSNFTISGKDEGAQDDSDGCGGTTNTYTAVTQGPNPVAASPFTTYAGKGLTLGGTVSNATAPAYTSTFQPLSGELLMQTTTQNNIQYTYTASAAPASYTLQTVLQPSSELGLEYVAPTGKPCFYENGTLLGCSAFVTAANQTMATYAVSGREAGTYTYTVEYPGDSNYSAYPYGNLVVTVP